MIDSSKFHLQGSLEANYLNVPLDGTAKPDEIAMNVLAEDCPDFLIPFKLMSHNDSTILKYRLVNAIALEYSNLTLSKAAFTDLYLSLLTPFLKGKDWFLDYHNICIDKSYVYLNKELTKALFIYIPEKSYRNSDEEILRFFQAVLSNVTITDDNGFLVQLYQRFSRGGVTLTELYGLVEEESKKAKKMISMGEIKSLRPAAPIPTPEVNDIKPDKQLNFLTPVPKQETSKPILEEKEKKRGFFGSGGKKKEEKQEFSFEAESYDSNDEVMKALFGEDKIKKKEKKEKPPKHVKEKGGANEKSKGLFGGRKKAADIEPDNAKMMRGQRNIPVPGSQFAIPQSQSYVQNSMPAAYMQEEDGATEIYEDGMELSGGYLELIDTSIAGAPLRMELGFDKPFITLGRISANSVKPDVAFGSELKRIGRMHARIERKEETFFIIDLGSANHTLLNGQVLIPNYPYPMKNGDEVSFAANHPVRYRVNLPM